MAAEKTKKNDYQTLKAATKNGGINSHDQTTLKPSVKMKEDLLIGNLADPIKQTDEGILPEVITPKMESTRTESFVPAAGRQPHEIDASYGEQTKRKKKRRKSEKDRQLLESEKWLGRNGHNLTYVGLYLFSILVFFRPYELIPALSFLSTSAFFFRPGDARRLYSDAAFDRRLADDIFNGSEMHPGDDINRARHDADCQRPGDGLDDFQRFVYQSGFDVHRDGQCFADAPPFDGFDVAFPVGRNLSQLRRLKSLYERRI